VGDVRGPAAVQDPPTAPPDLRGLVDLLGDDVLRIAEEVDPRFEAAAVLREAEASASPAVLFERIRGHPATRVVGNLLGARRRLARALGTPETDLVDTYLARRSGTVPPVPWQTGDPPVKEVVHAGDLDLPGLLPVLTHYERDAGPFITAGVVLARDPETGRQSMGVHRLMVKGGNRLGILLANPPLSRYHAAAEEADRPLEVAVAVGVDPATLVAAVAPVESVGPDKLALAGALRGAPLELVPAETVALDVPARAEFVLEGRVLPGLREPEGPLGETTGYYVETRSPVVVVTAVTHRRDPLYQAICPWGAEVDQLLSLAAGSELLVRLRAQFPSVADLELVPGTCGFVAAVALGARRAGEVRRLMALAMSLERRLKAVVVVDEDVDIRNPRDLAWALATRLQADRDVLVLPGFEGYIIDPSVGPDGRTAKVGLDATRGEGEAFDRIAVPAGAAARARALVASALRGARR
jgi:2,5-furandicarboxylate decarboxylase 1